MQRVRGTVDWIFLAPIQRLVWFGVALTGLAVVAGIFLDRVPETVASVFVDILFPTWFAAISLWLIAIGKITYGRFFGGKETDGTLRDFIGEALFIGFVAAYFFLVGLTGPLTPSVGHPSVFAWIICAILPLSLTLLGFFVVKSWAIKALLVVEFAGITAMTFELLRVEQIL